MEKHKHLSKEMQLLARKVQFLDGAERIKAFPPEELLNMLSIKKTDNILDLGAGTGYLTIPAAKMVDGLVFALDIDSEMLEIIDSKAKEENASNIKFINSGTDNITLPDSSIDIVLASLILHEVRPLSETIFQINRVLKEGGQFMCLEYEKTDSAADGPPLHIRVSSSVMERELKNIGLSVTHKVFLKDSLYVIIAKK